MTSRSWIECSMSVPPPAFVDVAAPGRAVHALDREVLVVAQHERHRPSVPAGRARSRRSRGTPARAAARARPGAGRPREQPPRSAGSPRWSARAASRRRPARSARRPRPRPRRQVPGGPGADPRDVDVVEQRPRGPAYAVGVVMARRARAGALGIGVEGRGDRRRRPARRRRAGAARRSARCRCGRSRSARSAARHSPPAGRSGRRGPPGSSSGPHRLARRPVRSRPGRRTRPSRPRRSPNRSRTVSTASAPARRRSRRRRSAPSSNGEPRPAPRRRPRAASAVTPSSRMPSSQVDRAQQRPRGCRRSRPRDRSASGRVWERVIVAEVAVAHLQLHGARRLRGARAAVPRRASAMRTHVALQPADDRCGRCANVSSWPIDFVDPVRLDRAVVAVPGQRVEVAPGRRRRACAPASARGARPGRPTVSTPRSVELAAGSPARRPRAGVTGSGCRNSSSVPGSTTSRPSGLARSLASLASSFVVAAPTDAVSPVSARIRRRSRGPDLGAGPERAASRRATSRNASSSEIGSTSGVAVAQDRHHLAARLGVRVEARGEEHRVGTRAPGPAPSASREWMPNRRAS